MEISCVAGIYRDKNLNDALKLISEAGYQNVEVGASPYQNWGSEEVGDKELKTVRKTIDDLSLNVTAVCGVNAKSISKQIEVAQFLGASTLVGGLNVRRGESFELVRKQIQDLELLLEKSDAKFGIENHYGALFENVDDGLKIMELAKSKRIGLTIDTGHLQWSGVNVIEAADALAEYTVNVHAKDVMFADGKKRLDREQFEQRRMTALGTGKVNLAGFVHESEKHGYEGYYSVEIERVSEFPTSTRQQWLIDSRKYLENLLR